MAKIVPLSPDSFPPPESAKLAAEFAILAKQDARAARLLYRNRLYGLSAFHVQQGVEKATKAVTLLMGFVEPTHEQLVRGVGHDSLNSVTVSLADFVEHTIKQWDESQRKAKESSDYAKGLTIVDAVMVALKERYIHETNDPHEVQKREEGMKNFLTMSERFAQMGASVEKVRNLDGIRSQLAALKGLLKKQRGYVWRSTMGLETNPGLETTISELRGRARQAEEALKAMKVFKSPKALKLLSDPDYIFYLSYIHGISFHMAMNLAVLTMFHEEPPRYPPLGAKDYWTFDAYGADSKFVKLLPELIEWTATYCEATAQGSNSVLVHYANLKTNI